MPDSPERSIEHSLPPDTRARRTSARARGSFIHCWARKYSSMLSGNSRMPDVDRPRPSSLLRVRRSATLKRHCVSMPCDWQLMALSTLAKRSDRLAGIRAVRHQFFSVPGAIATHVAQSTIVRGSLGQYRTRTTIDAHLLNGWGTRSALELGAPAAADSDSETASRNASPATGRAKPFASRSSNLFSLSTSRIDSLTSAFSTSRSLPDGGAAWGNATERFDLIMGAITPCDCYCGW